MTTQVLSWVAGIAVASPARWRWVVLVFGAGWVWLTLPVNHVDQLQMRLQTYQVTLQASWEHPWLGQGTGALAEPFMLQKYQAPLPAIHSAWLSLAFHHGWPAVLVAGAGLWRLVRHSRSRLGRGIATGLVVASLVDDLFRWPGLAAVALVVVMIVWNTQEARHA